jgi:AbiTii
MRSREVSLLSQIEEDVLSDRPLADTLRKCIILGGKAGSRDLREWASRELKGYESDDEPPEYRTVAAPILADAVTGNSWVKRQRIGVSALPDFVRADVDETFTFRQGVGQIEAMIKQSSAKGQVDLSLPMAAEIGRLMDQASDNPFQHIHALYWSVNASALYGIVDQVRTSLAELVAEIRAILPDDVEIPTAAAADQAVNVAVHGKRSTVTVTTAQAAEGSTAVVAPVAEENLGWWTRSRVVAAGIAGAASIAGLVFAVAQWRGWI